MNEVVNKSLLVGDKFMPEVHKCTHSASGLFTKNKERIQNFMQKRDTRYIYRNDLDEACFQYDMTYGNYKDLIKITESDKVLRDKAFKIASDLKYDSYEQGFFYKNSTGSGVILSKQFADELHKPIIKNF